MLNNPLMYSDPSGELLIAPILYGILSGALIGAATSAVVYTVTATITGNWSWQNFGNAILYGAVAGAISGGISGAFSSSAGAFFQSATFNVLKESASQIGSSLVFGDHLTFGTAIGSIAGGFVGAAIGGWKAVKGSWFKNAMGEIAFNTAKGTVRGVVSGGVGAVFDRQDIGQGMILGARNGAMGGFAQSVGLIAAFGATRQLTNKQAKYINAIQKTYNFKGAYTVRRGGLYQGIQSLLNYKRAVTWGNTIVAFNDTTSDTYGHEYGHIYQYYTQGWAQFQGKGLIEQMRYSFSKYNPYGTRGANEYWAEYRLQSVGGLTLYNDYGIPIPIFLFDILNNL